MSDSTLSAPRKTRLRASLYRGTLPRLKAETHLSAAAFNIVLLAVITEFCVSANTLAVLGIIDGQPGGNPFLKFAPGTYLAIFAAIVSIFGGPSPGRRISLLFSRAPALIFFIMSILFCMVFSAINVGITGVGVYVDTYLSAGALAVTMVNASDRQRRVLARMVLALCLINVVLSLAEYVHQDHIIPLEVNSKPVTDTASEEFRPAALYGHPLTGAMTTSFAVFLVLSLGLRYKTTAILFAAFAVGLLGFGGRAALGVTVAVLVLSTILTFVRDFMRGRVNSRLLMTVLLSVSVLGPLGVVLMTATPIGERLSARAYYDDSAEVRAKQWLVLDKLTPSQAMFGTPSANLEQIYEQVGLIGVENPFILIFLNLGIIGLPIFAAALMAYFVYLRHVYPASGWLLLAAILILSSSNSIGVKGPDLFLMTACAVTMSGRTGQRAVQAGKALRQPIIRYLRPILTTEIQPAKAGAAFGSSYRRLSPGVLPRK